MHDLIRAFALWARLVFRPRAGGRHRARPAARAADRAAVPVPPRPVPLPAARSPYGLDVPLNGRESAMVRPYLVADEQRQRRLALVLAADFGIDLDPHLAGAGQVAW
ncbi:hypothetical protein [Streptomyces sp. CB03238]|uniref:hypothetical protein n=1 Tax=Streptomyces sp. CB03238 TaxID=1907777 RepID=UPI000A0FF4AC|nr:hypothetical protein [Streptomyces sp. CB03238]ORT59409.1 hypothetical protein BKD26_15630 [Streptomyces sp. CB03238]